MKAPSDAQARVLIVVQDHEADGEELHWKPPIAPSSSLDEYLARSRAHRGWADLALEQMDREANTGRWMIWSQPEVTTKSLTSSIRHGWLDATHETVKMSGTPDLGVLYDSQPPDPVVLRWLRLTEDGTLALGLWRERKLHAPPPLDPLLALEDRTIVEAAYRAVTLGYRLVPVTDDARKQARRLRREGWVIRGHVGASASSVVPSSSGFVEVAPDLADSAMQEVS